MAGDLLRAGQRPVRVFFQLLGATIPNQVGMGLLYFLKASPMLLLPVLLAESIRLVGLNAPGTGMRLASMYAIFAIMLAANIPLHMFYVRKASKRLRAMELKLRAALVRRLQQLSMAYHSGRESGRRSGRAVESRL
jgi:ATP-binding cassette subfamily B protein